MINLFLVFLITIFSLPILSCSTVQKDWFFDNAGISSKDAKDFYSQLKEAVMADDKKKVADMIFYPTGADIKGDHVEVKDKEFFMSHYNEIVNQRIIRLIKKTKFQDLKPSWRGVFVGNGEIIFGGIGSLKKHKVFITMFNNGMKYPDLSPK